MSRQENSRGGNRYDRDRRDNRDNRDYRGSHDYNSQGQGWGQYPPQYPQPPGGGYGGYGGYYPGPPGGGYGGPPPPIPPPGPPPPGPPEQQHQGQRSEQWGWGNGGGRGRGHHNTGYNSYESRLEREKAKAEGLLGKRHVFSDHSVEIKPEHLFSSPSFSVEELQSMKTDLNAEKDRLDKLDLSEWERHASQVNRAGAVVPILRDKAAPEMCTIAWAKMWEVLAATGVLPEKPAEEEGSPSASAAPPSGFIDVTTAHLCEAPGAFISATNHFINQNRPLWRWTWVANSLNPYHEGNSTVAMIDDDELIRATWPHWFFGEDGTGDIRQPGNIRALWQRVRSGTGAPSGATLVTGDGAVDTQENPNEQEALTAGLHYCETVAALGCLAKKGGLVIKTFTLLEHSSLGLAFLLTALFDEFMVFKPATSKCANSETYLVGKGFRGISPPLLEALLSHCGTDPFQNNTMALVPRDMIPEAFVKEFVKASKIFVDLQAESLKEAVDLMAGQSGLAKKVLYEGRQWFAQEWVRRMGVAPLDSRDRLSPHGLTGRSNNTSNAVLRKRKFEGTLDDRRDQIKKRREALGEAGEGPLVVGAPGEGEGGEEEGGKTKTSAEGGEGGEGGEGKEKPKADFATRMMAKMMGGEFTPFANSEPAQDRHPRDRTGLGFRDTSAPEAPPEASFRPLPDAAPLENRQGAPAAWEVKSWSPSSARRAPLIKSKFCEDEALTELIALRRDAKMLGPGDAWGQRACAHVGPCCAPERESGAADRGGWRVRALDAATAVLKPLAVAAAGGEGGRGRAPVLLDLSLGTRGAGAAVWGREGEAWRVLAVENGNPLPSDLGPRGSLFTPPGGALSSASAADASLAEGIATWAADVAGGADLLLGNMDSYSGRFGEAAGRTVEMELSPSYRHAFLLEIGAALLSLRKGGAAVLSLGDLFTRFTAGGLYLAFRCFERMTLCRTFAACAAGGEKVVVLQGFLGKDECSRAIAHWREAAKSLSQLEPPGAEPGQGAAQLADLVPPPAWVGSDFYAYVASRANELVWREIRTRKRIEVEREDYSPDYVAEGRRGVAAAAHRALSDAAAAPAGEGGAGADKGAGADWVRPPPAAGSAHAGGGGGRPGFSSSGVPDGGVSYIGRVIPRDRVDEKGILKPSRR